MNDRGEPPTVSIGDELHGASRRNISSSSKDSVPRKWQSIHLIARSRISEAVLRNCWNKFFETTSRFDTRRHICPNSHPAASTLPINNRHTTSHPTPMPPRLNTELITRLRRRSSVLSGIVLLCLVGQALFPGVAMTVAALSTENSEVVGCCVVDLSRAAGPSCCCGPTSEKSCGCACGTKKFATTTVRLRNEESSDQSRTIQSEICGCGGNHRPGMITSIEPAVLLPIDEPLFRNADPRFPDSICECSANTQPPPTPPPELCV